MQAVALEPGLDRTGVPEEERHSDSDCGRFRDHVGTARAYVQGVVALPAGQAPGLIAASRTSGTWYVLPDGTLPDCDWVSDSSADHSGKHRCPGVNRGSSPHREEPCSGFHPHSRAGCTISPEPVGIGSSPHAFAWASPSWPARPISDPTTSSPCPRRREA